MEANPLCKRVSDPQTDVAPGSTRGRNVRSKNQCSMCPAIHTKSRSWLRSSSTREPSDPLLRVVIFCLFFGISPSKTILRSIILPPSRGRRPEKTRFLRPPHVVRHSGRTESPKLRAGDSGTIEAGEPIRGPPHQAWHRHESGSTPLSPPARGGGSGTPSTPGMRSRGLPAHGPGNPRLRAVSRPRAEVSE